MKPYPDRETAIGMWDLLDNDQTVIYFPVILDSSGGNKGAIFIEGTTQPDKTIKSLLRIFINRDEADSYRISRKAKVSIAKSELGKFMASLERNLYKHLDKNIECVLSTIDMDGNFHALETVWSTNKKPN